MQHFSCSLHTRTKAICSFSAHIQWAKNGLITNVFFADFNERLFFSPLACYIHSESRKTFSRCRPVLSFLSFFLFFFALQLTFEVNVCNLSSSQSCWVKNGSKQNQLIRVCITSVFYATLDPISSNLASPTRTHPPQLLQTPLIPHWRLYLHIFIYLLLHSWFSPNNPLQSHPPHSCSHPTTRHIIC